MYITHHEQNIYSSKISNALNEMISVNLYKAKLFIYLHWENIPPNIELSNIFKTFICILRVSFIVLFTMTLFTHPF